jgi:hypothetical protein
MCKWNVNKMRVLNPDLSFEDRRTYLMEEYYKNKYSNPSNPVLVSAKEAEERRSTDSNYMNQILRSLKETEEHIKELQSRQTQTYYLSDFQFKELCIEKDHYCKNKTNDTPHKIEVSWR